MKAIIILVLVLSSCSSQKNMYEYDFTKLKLSEDVLADHIPYKAASSDRNFFNKIINEFLGVYTEVNRKDYIFQYSFTKNKYADVEVWMRAFPRNPTQQIDTEEPYHVPSGSRTTYYAVTNITQVRAYFFRGYDPKDPFDIPNIKGYFYIDGKIKEVKNSILYIYEPTLWRNFEFDDWDTIE